MRERNVTITQDDFEKLNEFTQSQQSHLYGSMTGLEQVLRQSTLVAPVKIDSTTITMNSKVRVRDVESNEGDTYTLVYPKDADIDEGKVSVLAPIGVALLGAKVGQIIKVPTPGGFRRLKIERLLYQPVAANA